MESPASSVLRPDDSFHINGNDARITVGEFWQWGFSGLNENILRGVLAEYIVGRALGCNLSVRQSWDEFDLITLSGTTIEVKSTAYMQAWAQKSESALVFSGLRSKKWKPETGYADEETYGADVYVFCIQTARSQDEYDPLDLDQWKFRVVCKDQLQSLGYKSISMPTLNRIAPNQVGFEDLGEAVKNLVESKT